MLARLNTTADTWVMIWTWVDRILTINLGLAITNLPLLVALAVVDRPWDYPVFFGLLSLGLGPSLAAAFGYLDGASFTRSYLRHFGRALPRWAVVVGVVAVLATDVVALHADTPGALLVPMLIVLATLMTGTGILTLASLPQEHPTGVRLALYTTVRRWPLTLLNLTVLATSVILVNQSPLLGLATVPGCALIVVWTNARAALTQE